MARTSAASKLVRHRAGEALGRPQKTSPGSAQAMRCRSIPQTSPKRKDPAPHQARCPGAVAATHSELA